MIIEPASSSFAKTSLPKILNNSSLSNSAKSSNVIIPFSAKVKILCLVRSAKSYKSFFTFNFFIDFSTRSFSSLTKFFALLLSSEAKSSSNPSILVNSSNAASAISDIVAKPSLTIR